MMYYFRLLYVLESICSMKSQHDLKGLKSICLFILLEALESCDVTAKNLRLGPIQEHQDSIPP